MDSLDEFFARRDRNRGTKKFTRADELVNRLLQKKMEADDRYRRRQESNAALLAFENQSQDMETTSIGSGEMDLTGLRLANSSTATEGLLNRKGRRVHWWPANEPESPSDVPGTSMEVDDDSYQGRRETRLHLHSQRSFPSLTDESLTPKTPRSEGGSTTTTNTDTPGFRLDFSMADDENDDQDMGSSLTLSTRCDSLEDDGNEADTEL